MLNTVVLIGRVCKQVDLRYTPSSKAVATIRIAVDRGTTGPDGKREADFIDCIVWEKQAETCANHLTVGRLIAVQGRLQIRSYENAEGQRRERAEVVASQVRFLDKGQDASTPGGGERAGNGPRRDAPGAGSEPNFNDDDDVPF